MRDIRAFQPDVVLTIDSKGFTFRVLRALQTDPEMRDVVTRMHYVAPSVWAYKHRRKKQDFADMGALLDAMFTILPFEEEIFNPRNNAAAPKWCHFVGHPAVEGFFEFHGAFSETPGGASATDRGDPQLHVSFGPDALLDVAKYDAAELKARAKLVHSLLTTSSDDRGTRATHGISADAFVICALVGRYSDAWSCICRSVLVLMESDSSILSVIVCIFLLQSTARSAQVHAARHRSCRDVCQGSIGG